MDHFNQILQLIYKKSPLQKKKIEKYISTRNSSFFQEAEEFSKQYMGYLSAQNIPLEYAIDAYQKMCNDMMKSQIYFMNNDKYPIASAELANETVYSNEIVMKLYMIGLAISQFLWSTHYDMYSCLIKSFKKYSGSIKSYLEIGPGHGLFLYKAVELLNSDVKFTAVDISNTSIDITKSMLSFFKPNCNNINYHVTDMLNLTLEEKYDYITMGEVIEHVNFPETLLNKLHDLLNNNGRAFVSTCVNCPAIDHVYHFKTVDEIREMFYRCKFIIEEEIIAPVEDLPFEEIMKRKITINYCAILKKDEPI